MLDASPVTSQPVRLMQGRYGPYVSDGVTNASLPRGVTLEEVTLEYAVNLLKDRAAAGPSRRASRRKAAPRAGKKAAAKKKVPAKKKAPAKKARDAPEKAARRRLISTVNLSQRNRFVDQQHGDVVDDGVKQRVVGTDQSAGQLVFYGLPGLVLHVSGLRLPD